jgi:hypothetical protein
MSRLCPEQERAIDNRLLRICFPGKKKRKRKKNEKKKKEMAPYLLLSDFVGLDRNQICYYYCPIIKFYF